MAIGKTTTILAGTAIAGLGVATLAPTATAETSTTWIQQVQRASADAPCDIPEVEGEMAGWSDWGPSWAQWPHDGQGGWVCTRSITWAHGSGSGPGDSESGGSDVGSGCVTAFEGYLDFDGANWIPSGSTLFSDSACTTPVTTNPLTIGVVAVLAADRGSAQTLCDEHATGTTRADLVGGPSDPRLYWCNRI